MTNLSRSLLIFQWCVQMPNRANARKRSYLYFCRHTRSSVLFVTRQWAEWLLLRLSLCLPTWPLSRDVWLKYSQPTLWNVNVKLFCLDHDSVLIGGLHRVSRQTSKLILLMKMNGRTALIIYLPAWIKKSIPCITTYSKIVLLIVPFLSLVNHLYIRASCWVGRVLLMVDVFHT